MHQPINYEFACVDCQTDTMRDEYYAVHDSVWRKAKMRHDGGMLCIGCLEHRIGRQLNFRDFIAAPINSLDLLHPWYFPKSTRLMMRLLSPG